jgi:hypothetical protein
MPAVKAGEHLSFASHRISIYPAKKIKRLCIRRGHLPYMQKTRAEATAELAHELWVGRGSPHGSAEQDWYEAERILHDRAAEAVIHEVAARREARVGSHPKRAKKHKTKTARATGA